MNKFASKSGKVLAVFAVLLGLVNSAVAIVMYDNSTNYRTNFFISNLEFGDQISLDGQARTMTNFSFEYFASGLGGGETALLTLYANNGPTNSPGTVLFASSAFPVGNGQNTVVLDGLSLLVPSSLTWTVKFSGVTGAEQAGLPLYYPATVGNSLDDFWQKDAGGNWFVFRYPGGVPQGSFAATLSGVPEMNTVFYALFGGAGLFAFHSLRRRALKSS